ncbi:MAG: acyltransferase family protein [Pseudomonadota bacterium]
MKYRAEMDGLRALAVVPVIAFHAGWKAVSGGFAGVDVFFVISGFLITTILLEDIEHDRFSISHFYERRARRILPALIAVLAVSAFAAWVMMLPHDFVRLARELMANATFTSNVHYTLSWGYFQAWRLPPVFLNTWSLAVEEQFYVLFPLLLLFCKGTPGKRLFLYFAVLLVVSLVWAEVSSRLFPQAAYYLLPSRAWELLTGALVAVFLRDGLGSGYVSKRTSTLASTLSITGLVLIFVSFFAIDDRLRYPSLATVPPVLGTALLIVFARADQVWAKALSAPAVVYTGKISYSLYLWHFPVLILLRYALAPQYDAWFIGACGVLITVVLAVLTYHLVEQPFRRKRLLASRRALLATSAVALVVCAAIGLGGHLKRLTPYSVLRHPGLNHLLTSPGLPGGVGIRRCAATNARTECRLVSGGEGTSTAPRREFLIVGDSHMADLISPLAQLFAGQDQVGLSARVTYACTFMPATFENWRGACGKARQRLDAIQPERATDVVFTVNFVRAMNRRTPAERVEELGSLLEMVDTLAARGVTVHLITHRQVYNIEPTRAFVMPALTAETLSVPPELFDFYDASERRGARVYRPKESWPPLAPHLLYKDAGHLSVEGAGAFLRYVGIRSLGDLTH